MDALCALLDCALGFFPCYFLFGRKSTCRGPQPRTQRCAQYAYVPIFYLSSFSSLLSKGLFALLHCTFEGNLVSRAASAAGFKDCSWIQKQICFRFNSKRRHCRRTKISAHHTKHMYGNPHNIPESVDAVPGTPRLVERISLCVDRTCP